MNRANSWRLYKLLSEVYGRKASYSFYKRLLKLLNDNPIPSRQFKPSQRDAVLIAYGDHLNEPGTPPLKTLACFCEKHLKDYVNTVHVLPYYPSTSDDGFSVSDYLAVYPRLGTWEDVNDLSKRFHLMVDGIFNHTSASHKWFKGFLADDHRYKDYFIVLDKTTDVSLVTRPRTSPLLIAHRTAAGEKYVWATFSDDQLDLNYANPEVLFEVIAIILEYIRHGADVIRLDAVGFIWKELGTRSIHRPRAHSIIRLLREMLSQTAPWVRLVTETNVPHNENTTYFGNGRNEAHMIYNFALPPLLVHTLQTGSASCLTDWAAGLDTPSKEAAFFNFTASHDGIGLLGVKNVLSDEQINDMCELVQKRGGRLSMRTNAEGKESVYEMNIGYFNAVTEPKAFLKDRVDQFMCSQAIALSLKGVPGIYLHSLLGYANWEEGVRITGHNRAINREKLQLDDVEQELADPASRCRQVFDRYIRLLKVRSEEPAFSPKASQKIRKRYGPKVFAVERKLITKGARVLALHNVSSDVVILDVSGRWLDLVSGAVYEHEVRLAPYQVAWLKRMFPRKRDRLKRRARSIANTRSKVRKLVNRSLAPFS